ncbi:MAG: glycosyltransferase family A protein [Desulfovibrionaceae bacterium]
MLDATAFSFILHDLAGTERLARLLFSLAGQSAAGRGLEVVFVQTSADDAPVRLAQRCMDVLPRRAKLILLKAPGEGLATALNTGSRHASGQLLCFPQPGMRLDPCFAEAHLRAFRADPNKDLISCDFIHSGPQGSGLVRLPQPAKDRLRTRNSLGPLITLSRRAAHACAFRSNSPFLTWEMGIEAAQHGFDFLHLRRPLYSVPAEDWNSGGLNQELARLVARQYAFFDPSQVHWALGVLRHRAWATAYRGPHLPTPQDVHSLMEGYVLESRLSRYGLIPEKVLPGPLPSCNALGA